MKKNLSLFVIMAYSIVFSFMNVKALDINEISKILDKSKMSKVTIEKAFDEDANSDNKTINPLWIEYNKLSDEEKENWAVIPEKYIIEYTIPYKKLDTYTYGINLADNIPAQFDLRNVNGKNYVSPIKNQDQLGLCWAFTTNSSVESNILRLELRNSTNPAQFSERQIDYLVSKPTNNIPYNSTDNKPIQVYNEGYNPYSLGNNLGEGGNFSMSALYYGLGFAPMDMVGMWSTYDQTHKKVNLSDVYNINNQSYAVTDYVKFPFVNNWTANETTKSSWRDMIKKHVMNYGSVYVGTAAPQQSTSGACYIADTTNNKRVINWNKSCNNKTSDLAGTHAMSIIGWDDDYELSYCAYDGAANTYGVTGRADDTMTKTECTEVSGTYHEIKGAWILKNSWGTAPSTYPRDYVYLAYDSYIQSGVGGVVNTTEIDFDNTYNLLGPIYYYEDGTSEVDMYYKTKNVETLKRISFETDATSEVTYTAFFSDIYGNTIELGSKTVSTPGRYSIDTVDLSKEINIYGTEFTIMVTSSINGKFQPTSIYAFTDDTTEEQAAITLLSKKTNSSSQYVYDFSTRTSNVDSGALITYKITDIDGNDYTSSFNNIKSYVVAGGAGVSFTTSSNILKENKIYYVETYLGDKLLGKDAFTNGINLNGSGTEDDPFILNDIKDFEYLYTFEYYDSEYKLENDINLSNINNFEPLGLNMNQIFMGYLDGNNKTITGLNQNGEYGGLFYDTSGIIYDLSILNTNINVSKTAGALASNAFSAYISGIRTEGLINATDRNAYIGGIIGKIEESTIDESYNKVSLNNGKAGALVGYFGHDSYIYDSFNIGNIYSDNATPSSFFGDAAYKYNLLSGVIDFAQNNSPNCIEDFSSYDPHLFIYEGTYYYSGSACNYVGKELDDTELRTASNYNFLDDNYWTVEDGKYPKLNKYPIEYVEDISVNAAKNLYVGDQIPLEVTIKPQNPTYSNLEYAFNNINFDENEDGSYTFNDYGPLSIQISATDASHKEATLNIYAFSQEFKSKLINDKYIVVKDKTNITDAKDYLQEIMTEVVLEDDKYLGTGKPITYTYNGTTVGEYTALVKGDVSGDGTVGSNDILQMRRHILKLSQMDATSIIASDINGEGLSSSDVLKIRRYILKMEDNL